MLVLFAIAGPAAAAASAPASALKAVIADYDRFNRQIDPISAGLEGDQAALRRWPDDSPRAVAARKVELTRFKARLQALRQARLAPEGELNRAYLAWLVDDALGGYGFDQEREPFSSDSGPFDTPDYVARATAMHTRADADAWLARLKALPVFYDVEIADARRGVATGFMQPRYIAQRVLDAAGPRAAEPAEDSVLLIPFKELPATISAADQAALRQQALAVVNDEVKPKERAYVEMIQREYLPAASASLAAGRYSRWIIST